MKEHAFTWAGKNRQGVSLEGEIVCKNVAIAKYRLKGQGITVTKIRKKKESRFGSKVQPMDVVLFTRQLATMMKAGVPMAQALDIIVEGLSKDSMRRVVMDIRSSVLSGKYLSAAMREHPKHFDDLYCSLVESGEDSGNLETMLGRLATYGEKSEALKKKIKKAMTYPSAVIAVAIVVTSILLVKVVPSFATTFNDFGAELPAFTLWVLSLSEFFQEYWLWSIPTFYGLWYGFKFGKRYPSFNLWVDRLVLRLPIFGQIAHDAIIARFTRTLSTTFGSGVPVVEAMDSAIGSAGNLVYQKVLEDVKENLTSGMAMHTCFRATKKFPIMVVQMTSIGEESGTLDEMLSKVADHYEMEVDNAVDSLSSLMEPMIMSVLGVLIGGLMVAMYLPIFQLGSVI